MSAGEGEEQQQEVELNLRLDSDGRTTFDPSKLQQEVCDSSVDYSSKTVLSKLASSDGSSSNKGQKAIEDDLLYDCEIADCGLLPRTFWMPQGMKPRCRLEQMALEVFNRHVPNGCTYDAASSGAEWWVQIRPSPPLSGRYSMHADSAATGDGDKDDNDDMDMAKSGISFHWDKDEDLRLAMGGTMNLHPHLSTVTYLTNIGAPTMVLNYRVNALTGEYIEPSSSGDNTEGYVSWPRKGKHLSFDGRYLHAAPGDLLEEGEFSRQCKYDSSGLTDDKEVKKLERRHRRVTFLVNVWLNYKPFNVDLFPETMIDNLSAGEPVQPILFDNDSKERGGTTTTCHDASAVIDEKCSARNDGKSEGNEVFTWPMGGCGSNERIQAMMPLHTIQKEKELGGNICIEWINGIKKDGGHKDGEKCGVAILDRRMREESAVEPDSKKQKVV